jgi:hypothetical protein
VNTENNIERYLSGEMDETERLEFEKAIQNDPFLNDLLKMEKLIIEQIRNQAFAEEQIKTAKEELKQEKFERYLLDQMTGTEKAEFETDMENNPLLKEQLELECDIVQQIQQIRSRAFVEHQINVAKKEMKNGRIIKMTLYTITSIAAVFLLFFVINGLFQNQKYETLYAASFEVYPNDYVDTEANYRGDATIDSLLLSAMAAYEKKKFTEAEVLFYEVLNKNDNPGIRFYLAVAQLETGKTELAINTLNSLYSQPKDFPYYEQTRWYLALAHLKLYQKSEAKKYLDELVDLEGYYFDKTKELVFKL